MISFIIVHYKTYEYTKQAIQSIFSTVQGLSYEVIVLDNASNDGSVELLETDFANEVEIGYLKFLASEINGGFSYGNNTAYAESRGNYIVLLNSDAELTGNVVRNSIRYLEKNPSVGAVTARIVNQFGELDEACKRGFPSPKNALIYFMNLGRIFPKLREFNTYKLNHLDQHKLHIVDAISGAYMAIPKTVIEKVGFFDETFFMYGEDLDLCYRIKEAGFEVHYNPELGDVIHYKGMSGKRLKYKTTYEFYRAMEIFYTKHYEYKFPWIISLMVIFAIYLLFVLKVVVGSITFVIKRKRG